MCEQFVARASEPFRLDELWPFVEGLERYGVAGFSWGAAWLDAAGGLRASWATTAFRDDPGREVVGANETTSVLLHLRRPSKFSTLGLADTQPFCDPARRFAFSHNGELTEHRARRARYRAAGRIHGRADSEVAMRWLEDAWGGGTATHGAPIRSGPADRLTDLHATFGGKANLAVLTAGGDVVHYAGNDENPVFAFRLGRIGLASTAVYSIDRSLFRLVAVGATERRLVRPGWSVALDATGRAVAAGPSVAAVATSVTAR